jgi:hypothetical protein
VPRPSLSSASLLVLPYDSHDAASVAGTAELRVQTICVRPSAMAWNVAPPLVLDAASEHRPER